MEQNLGKFSESIDFEAFTLELNDSLGNKDKSQHFHSIVAKIEADLASMKEIIQDLNKMRETTAKFESQLVTQVNTSTWKEISELIGLSRANIIDDCFKIFDRPDDEAFDHRNIK